jgi:ParB-like chromosome segregation protein Spo0J
MNDRLEPHPLAELFPLIEGAEFDSLVADIKANGLIDPIVTFEGKILDGRNRYRACIDGDVEVRTVEFADGNPLAFVVSKNVHRRHLTADQKRNLVAELIMAAPEKSDRQIAEQTKVSPTTVGKVRKDLEHAGDVSKLDTRADTKGRKQPAHKATSAVVAAADRAEAGGRVASLVRAAPVGGASSTAAVALPGSALAGVEAVAALCRRTPAMAAVARMSPDEMGKARSYLAEVDRWRGAFSKALDLKAVA